jgi:peptide/nickel transport system permease protein
MTAFVLKRLASAVLVLFVLVLALFLLQQASPVDPARALVGDHASPAVLDAARHRLGLDRPLYRQFFSYIGGLFRLDFGTSTRTHHGVASDLADFLPPTLELLAVSLVLAVGGGLLLGVLTARGGVVSSAVRFMMVLLASVPGFLMAILLVLLFYSRLDWLPATGQSDRVDGPSSPTGFLLFDSLIRLRFGVMWDGVEHLILPAFTLAVIPAVAIGRTLSSSLQSVLRQDYIRTARMKGLRETTLLLRHALRNCLNSTLAMTGLQVAVMFASLAVVEVVFAWPGIGNYLAQAIPIGDLAAVTGVSVVIGLIFIVVNLVVDLLQGIADPRIGVRSGRSRQSRVAPAGDPVKPDLVAVSAAAPLTLPALIERNR